MEVVTILSRIKNNIKYILVRFATISSFSFGLISTFQLFFNWDIFGIKNEDISIKIIILLSIVVACFVIALIWALIFSKRKTLYISDNVEIIAMYGDLMKIAFPKKREKEKIVVIAVNRCFDTIVNQDLIKADTVHGQFLNKIASNDFKRKALDNEIEKSLKEFGYEYEELSKKDKKYGKLKRYPLGSVARIKGENGITFFLLALTTFDENCVAHCDKQQFVECLFKLFEFYDMQGQGNELFLYPMGTSMARVGVSKKESLDTTIMLTKISKNYLKSKTNIVVYKKDKNELSISSL